MKRQLFICLVAAFGFLQAGPASAHCLDPTPNNNPDFINNALTVYGQVSGIADSGEFTGPFDVHPVHDSGIGRDPRAAAS